MSKNKTQTANWKERRRFHAVKLKNKGWKHREIATALDVSKGAVSRWFKRIEENGKGSLHARPHTGRPPELTDQEKRLIPDYLDMVQKPMDFVERYGLVRAYEK
jgi:transposase